MQLVIEKVHNCNGSLFRNIIAPKNDPSVFDDLSKNKEATKYALELSLSVAEKSNSNSAQFDAIDFVFLQRKWEPSRFSDGSYPSWHGSKAIETTFHETAYHWHRKFIQAPTDFSIHDQPIKIPRRIYTVSCNATLIDLRQKHKQYPELADSNIHSYKQTQAIGKYIVNQGFPGLITISPRHKKGENIVLFRQEFLSSVRHEKDVLYTYYPTEANIIVSELPSNQEIIRIPVLN